MNTVVLLSGGLDSSVLAAYLQKKGDAVWGLFIDYGQRHRVKEGQAAYRMANWLNISRKFFQLEGVFGSNNALTGNLEVPLGEYGAETMATTVVPNRNSVLLNIAAAYAEGIGYDQVAYAAHGGDHVLYPDCTPEWVSAFNNLLKAGDLKVRLIAPFVWNTKAEIVTLGEELGVPMQHTWSCYKGGEDHCGECATCIERRRAFETAGVNDYTEYER